ncbi:ABC transporter substrate-binding protein [Nonomuraea sp. KM90]|uniref:ABC transporter substrate-binding protein n=1 Tax=Nonomuraea sp. KM90 TaxID=3457428 RepID=UPI003FCE6797
MRKALSFLSAALVLSGCSAPEPSLVAGYDKIVLAYMAIPDNAAAWVAIKRGFFAEQRLDVETQEIRGTAEAVPKLLSGAWQFALVNYVSLFLVEEENPGALDLVSDAYAALPNTFLLMVAKDSPIKSLKDLKPSDASAKKTVGVATLKSVATLTTEITLDQEGITKKDFDFLPVKLPDMPSAVQAGKVNLGWHTEPFISVSQKKGLTTLADACSGPSDKFPIAGYAVSTSWVNSDPRHVRLRAGIVARFRRALDRAQHIVASDRTAVTQIIPEYTKIEPATAAVITLGSFPTTLEATRYRRVADAMEKFGYFTHRKPEAEDLLWRPPGSSSAPGSPSPSLPGATP